MSSGWGEFKAAPPGERFQRRFRAKRAAGTRRLWRILSIAGGTLLLTLGLFLLVTPGPGALVLVLGGALVAGESMWMARFLDWLEVRIRRAISALR